jgi:hypothetical protein
MMNQQGNPEATKGDAVRGPLFRITMRGRRRPCNDAPGGEEMRTGKRAPAGKRIPFPTERGMHTRRAHPRFWALFLGDRSCAAGGVQVSGSQAMGPRRLQIGEIRLLPGHRSADGTGAESKGPKSGQRPTQQPLRAPDSAGLGPTGTRRRTVSAQWVSFVQQQGSPRPALAASSPGPCGEHTTHTTASTPSLSATRRRAASPP